MAMRMVGTPSRYRTLLLLLLLAPMAGPLDAQQPMDTAVVLGALRDYEAACASDHGVLWAHSLCGPIAIVDPITRLVITNDTVPRRTFLPYGGAFVGTLPDSIGIANTSVKWGGHRWAMVMRQSISPGDRFSHTKLLVHEAFHREQDTLGLGARDVANPHLDELEGRRWLRLELRALAAALDALDRVDWRRGSCGDTARGHARDGMLFRAMRYALYPAADSLERQLEMQEGLAEYTGARVAMAFTGDPPSRVARDVREFQSTPTFVRSFAYGTGPALGLLLDCFDSGWRDTIRRVRAPGAMLTRALGAPPTGPELRRDAERRAAEYGGTEVAREESTRASAQRVRIAGYRARLVDGPVVHLEQDALARGFNPNTLVSFDSSRTVYPTGSFAAPWGSLEVTDGGALTTNDFGHLWVSAVPRPGVVRQTVTGAGWKLTLNDGWSLVPGVRSGDYTVRKTP